MTSLPYIPPRRIVWRPYVLKIPVEIFEAWGRRGLIDVATKWAGFGSLPMDQSVDLPRFTEGTVTVRIHLPVHQVEGLGKWPWALDSPEETVARFYRIVWSMEGRNAVSRLSSADRRG